MKEITGIVIMTARNDNGSFKEYRKFTFSKESGGDGHLFIISDVRRKKDL